MERQTVQVSFTVIQDDAECNAIMAEVISEMGYLLATNPHDRRYFRTPFVMLNKLAAIDEYVSRPIRTARLKEMKMKTKFENQKGDDT